MSVGPLILRSVRVCLTLLLKSLGRLNECAVSSLGEARAVLHYRLQMLPLDRWQLVERLMIAMLVLSSVGIRDTVVARGMVRNIRLYLCMVGLLRAANVRLDVLVNVGQVLVSVAFVLVPDATIARLNLGRRRSSSMSLVFVQFVVLTILIPHDT